jgi:hypothetical protein
MEQQQQAATLRDVLNYEPETYLSEDDMQWIRDTFKNNHKAISIVRKIFLPYYADLPVEEMTKDVWFSGGFDPAMMSEKEAKSLIVARQDMIKQVMGGLIQLKMLANTERAETAAEKALRKQKDSNK